MKLFQFTRENLLYFRKQIPRKNFLYFLKRKLFLYFGKQKPRENCLYFKKRKPEKNSLYFRKRNFSYILGKEYSEPCHNGTILIFQEMNIQHPGFFFQKWRFLPLYFFIFQEVTLRAQKMKKPLLKCFLYFGKETLLLQA